VAFFKMKVKGDAELRKKLRGLQGAFLEEMATAIPAEAGRLLEAANATVPRQSGELAGSAVVSSERSKNRIAAAVAYTDDKAPAVHEGIHWGVRFGEKEPGFKWFEKAMRTFSVGFAERIAERLRKLVGG
jgi:hypothetical protein